MNSRPGLGTAKSFGGETKNLTAHMSNPVISLFGEGRKPVLQFTSPTGIHNSTALMILGDKYCK